MNAFDKLKELLTGQKRALGFQQLSQQIIQQYEVLNPVTYDPQGMMIPPSEMPLDVYLEADGSIYLITSKEGRLYKYSVSIKKDTVTLGKPEPVTTDFIPQKRSTVSTGPKRWFVITATAAMNRDRQIDSRQLFDNFIRRAEESGKYPYYTFYHLGEQFKIGQADFLARDGYVYMASGEWEDNDLARAAKKALAEDTQGYWGASNRFLPIGDPEILRAEGVEIPVFNDGIHIEISLLPEQEASSLFTRSAAIPEKTRMNQNIVGALKVLFADDASKADEWVNKIDEINRTIAEESLIARAEDKPAPETPAPEPVEGETEVRADAPATDAPAADAPAVDAKGTPVPATIEIDDALLQKIAEAVVKILEAKKQSAAEAAGTQTNAAEADAKMTAKLEELQRALDTAKNDSDGKITALMQDLLTMGETLEKLLQSDTDKKRSWMAEMTSQVVPMKITYRPRQKNEQARQAETETEAEEEVAPSFADIAAETLSNLKDPKPK